MWFKNLCVFQVTGLDGLSLEGFRDVLEKRPLVGCSNLQTQTFGWMPLSDDGPYVAYHEKHLLFCMGHEQKVLPASAVNEAVKAKAKEMEAQRGFKPGRKQLRAIKDEVTISLLPRALSRRTMIKAWLTPAGENQLLIVDSSSAPRAEELVKLLREGIPEFSATRVEGDLSSVAAMTRWLSESEAPGDLYLSDECELVSPDESRAAVKFSRHYVDQQVLAHLEQGKVAVKLGLVWDHKVSFTLTEHLNLKKVKLLDIKEESSANNDDLEAEEALHQEFALMTGLLEPAVRGLIAELKAMEQAA